MVLTEVVGGHIRMTAQGSVAVLCLVCVVCYTMCMCPSHVYAATVTLEWDDLENDPRDVTGYILYYWQADWESPAYVEVGDRFVYTLSDLEADQTYFFSVTAYDNRTGRESAFSNIVRLTFSDDHPLVIEAEAMALRGYVVESNAAASQRAIITRWQAPGQGSGTAIAEFSGLSGFYDIAVEYFDEDDGQSVLMLAVNDAVVSVWRADADFPSATPDRQTLTQREVARDVLLFPGDTVALIGYEDRQEYASVDRITFTLVYALD